MSQEKKNRYIKEHYFRMNLALPEEYGEKLETAAELFGMSRTSFIRYAVDRVLDEKGEDGR